MERRRAGPGHGSQRIHRPPLSRPSHGCLDDTAIASLPRKCRQAPGEGPKDLRSRHGSCTNSLASAHTKELLNHPKVGASWEGFVIEQLLMAEPHDEAFFWSTHQGAEIDLILRRGRKLLGVECKRTDTPRTTQSVRIAMEDIGLSRVAILYPGTKRFTIAEKVEAVPIQDLSRRANRFISRKARDNRMPYGGQEGSARTALMSGRCSFPPPPRSFSASGKLSKVSPANSRTSAFFPFAIPTISKD